MGGCDEKLRRAVKTVLEGWTLPTDARKILEAAVYATPQPAEPALTDKLIDRILSAPIPGGSAARDWFLPHDTELGLSNVRRVVREMLRAAGVKEPPNALGQEPCAAICARSPGTKC